MFLNAKTHKYNRSMFPAIFLDRDGVLIENKPDYVRDWSQVKIYPDTVGVLSLSTIKNYKIVIVTNQSAVGRGLISLETAEEINRKLVDYIRHHGGQIDAVYMCPHSPDDGCSCRKPKPGLLLQAAKDLSLDVSHSWMIGDAWSDVLAGQSAGVRLAILLKTGRGRDQLLQSRPENVMEPLILNDLASALDTIFTVDHTQVTDQDLTR